MFANGYVGTNADAVRIRRQEKEREKERKKYEEKAAEKEQAVQSAGLKQFAATTTEALEHAFKNETIGLVTKADFVKKRTTIQDRLEEEQRKKQELEELALQEEKERKRRDKLQRNTGKLSFAAGMNEDEEESEDPVAAEAPPLPKLGVKLPDPEPPQKDTQPHTNSAAAAAAAAAGTSQRQKADSKAQGEGSGPASTSDTERPVVHEFKRPKKVTKAPGVMTDFLPDRDREQREEELRKQLKKEYEAQQNQVKSEPLAIVYSYWDGSGHRREIRCKKGDTIGNFLKAVKEQLIPDFRELRHVSVDNLLYVKEDIILPHHYTFYDLIVNKARGKSGPLFEFGVHEDIRVTNDASREKNESHAGKVVERHWYDRNKHIFPASRWEVYDPDKTYDAYSIYG